MYKLNIDSINEVKYSNTDAHGLFSGTIETDRVVLVDGDGKYLQVDGNFGTSLDIGLVRTYSATRDSAETAFKIATTSATTTAAVYIYADVMKLQSDFADVDAFVEYLVDTLGLITIQDYENPKYQLKAATIKTAGSGYTVASVDVEVPGQTGDTAGVVTVTITEGACSAAEIKSAGSYESLVASQDLTVGEGNGKITVTMEEVSDAKSATRSAPVEESEEEPVVETKKRGRPRKEETVEEEPESEPEVVEEPVAEPEPEPEPEPEVEQEVDTEVDTEVEQPAEQPEEESEPESEPEEK